MRIKRRLEKLVFLTSAVLLAMLYGYGTRAFGWFPGSYLGEAIEQLAAHLGPPRYLGPRVHDREGARIEDADRMSPGLTLIASHFEEWDWRPGIRLIDAHGNTVHQWQADPERIFDDIGSTRGILATDRSVHGSYLFPNGDVVLINTTVDKNQALDLDGPAITNLDGGIPASTGPVQRDSYGAGFYNSGGDVRISGGTTAPWVVSSPELCPWFRKSRRTRL